MQTIIKKYFIDPCESQHICVDHPTKKRCPTINSYTFILNTELHSGIKILSEFFSHKIKH